MPKFSQALAKAPKKKSRRGYRAIEALDPRDRRHWQLLLPNGLLRHTARRGVGAAYELGRIVPETLMTPNAVFQGLRDEEESDWLCYVGAPSVDVTSDMPARYGQVFTVTTTVPDLVVYGWEWRYRDEDNADLPEEWQGAFAKRLV